MGGSNIPHNIIDSITPTHLEPLLGSQTQTSSLDLDIAEVGGSHEWAWKNDSVHVIPDEYRFSRMGGCPVVFRSGIVRLVFMKLLATGLLVAVVGVGGDEDGGINDFALGCAMCVAVNGVAVVHYYLIWRVRAQALGPEWKRWRANVGRAPNPSGASEKQSLLLKREKDHDSNVIYAQEMYVDGLRHSDWAVTLILMVFHLHNLAYDVRHAHARFDPKLMAALQPVMVLLGSVGRFYTNELRNDASDPPRPAKWWVATLGALSYVLAGVIFGFTCQNLLEQTGLPSAVETQPATNLLPATSRDRRHADALVVRAVILAQIGYPVVTAISLIVLHQSVFRRLLCLPRFPPQPGNTYPMELSLFKDVGYGTLDVCTKGGLALYTALRVQL